MLLIETLAVIGVFADAHVLAEAELNLAKPVRIGQRLARRADDVADAARQIVFRHLEVMDAAGADDRHLTAGLAHRFADLPRSAAALRPNGPRSSEMNCGMHS